MSLRKQIRTILETVLVESELKSMTCQKCFHYWNVKKTDDSPYFCHDCGYDNNKKEFDLDKLKKWMKKNSEKVSKNIVKENSAIAYTGVLFEGVELKKLLEKSQLILDKLDLDIDDSWNTPEEYHMTVMLGVLPLGMKVRGDLGAEVDIEVNEIGVSDKAIAFGVTGYLSKNEKQHITLYFKEKPADSKLIKKWFKISKPFIVKGVITEFKSKIVSEIIEDRIYSEKEVNAHIKKITPNK